MKAVLAAAIITTLAGPALAQHHHEPSPYAGMQQRAVKAMTDQQIADLKNGRGMGLALAGELNGYPGPLHVLELADKLHLSLDQHARVKKLFEDMKAEAVAVGANRRITRTSIEALTAQIGEAQGQLRSVHLQYHLLTADLLTMHQRHQYAELRGYR